jgi:hypothetical protein
VLLLYRGCTPWGKKRLICCHKLVSSWVFFSETGLYAVLFHDETRVAMLLTVERYVGDNPGNVCRRAYLPHDTHKHSLVVAYCAPSPSRSSTTGIYVQENLEANRVGSLPVWYWLV